ncbi:MAG: T9SS type A sorting domain-containing protein [Bacteroidales bacterium]|nr:T9SS type A sorting domain-containing protein [Bacteroidales bacterium]
MNTHYQIYTITGQVVQTGITTPDISTAQLNKGIYILRLENGKVFKFVK